MKMVIVADSELYEILHKRAYWFNEGRLAHRNGNCEEGGMPEHGRCNAGESMCFRAGYFAADAGLPDLEIREEGKPYFDPSLVDAMVNSDLEAWGN